MGAIGDSPRLPHLSVSFAFVESGYGHGYGNGKSIDRTFNLNIKNPHLPLG